MSTRERPTANDIELRSKLRLELLRRVLPSRDRGYICLARKGPGDKWFQSFLKYPKELELINGVVEAWMWEVCDIYFCPHLLSKPERKKEYALPGKVLWADLDDCPARVLGRYGEPLPQILIATSLFRSQAYWLLKDPLEPTQYEALNKRIAFAYRDEGCDQGGWDLTQLLRVPYTYNHKREFPCHIYEVININIPDAPVSISSFDCLPELPKQPETRGDEQLRLTFEVIRPFWIRECFQEITPEGKRDDICFRLALYFLKHYIREDVVKILIPWAQQNCEQPPGSPFTEGEVLKIINHAYNHLIGKDDV